MGTRKIDQKLFDYIDKKLAAHGAAQLAIKTKDARSLLCYAAEACVGIREVGGNNRGPMVELIQKSGGGSPGDAWCMWFVQVIIAYVEKKLGIKSPLYHSGSCSSVWNKSPKSSRVKVFPLAGAIIYWKDPKSGLGHTGFFIEALSREEMITIEGNTESGIVGGEVERDGGGIYMARRSMKKSGKKIVVGFLKPF